MSTRKRSIFRKLAASALAFWAFSAPPSPFLPEAWGACCLTSADCTDPGEPVCEAGTCRTPICTSSADCTDQSFPNCESGECVAASGACNSDADCFDPLTPLCNQPTGECVSCLADSDCGGATPYCHATAKVCVECLGASDCWSDESCGGSCACGVCQNDGLDCFNDDAGCGGFCDAGSCGGGTNCQFDVNACGGSCSLGTCLGGIACNGTETCDVGSCIFGCGPEPPSACDFAASAKIKITNHTNDNDDKLGLKMRGGAPAYEGSSFGDPTASTLTALCLYDGQGLASDSYVGPDATLWRKISTSGFKYKDPTATVSGAKSLSMKAGRAGSPRAARVKWTAKGLTLPTPLLPLANPDQVSAALISTSGLCLRTDFSTGQSSGNTIKQSFKASAK